MDQMKRYYESEIMGSYVTKTVSETYLRSNGSDKIL